MSSLLRSLSAAAAAYLSLFFVALTTAVPWSSAGAQQPQADICDSVLSGLVDFKTSVTEEQFAESILNWMKSTKASSENNARNQGANVGFSIPGALDDFTGAWNDQKTSSRNYSEAMHDHFSKDSASKKKFFELIKAANPTVVNAWLECKKESHARGRLRCWADPKFGDEKYVTIFYDLQPVHPQPTKPKIKDLVIAANLSETGKTRKESRVVASTAADAIIFTRKDKDREGGFVQIRTDFEGFHCIARVPPLPLIDKSPGSPCIQADDNGECTKCMIVYPNKTRMPELVVGVTPPSQFCPNMKQGDYRATFTGILRSEVPMSHAFPRVNINDVNRAANVNFFELGARLEPPAAPRDNVLISSSSGATRLQPINKQISAMLHINGPTHCRTAYNQYVPCFLEDGRVLIEPY